ncbi:MAG: S46 family peptidase [Calditrichia bacterium]
MKYFTRIVMLIILISTFVLAEEGMFLLNRLPMDQMKKAGLKLNANDIYNPGQGGLSDAVVIIGGGTGAFVSGEGLVITNHHVAYGALQRVSSPENNILMNGFYADTKEKEIVAPGYTVTITLGFDDITDQVLKGVKENMDPVKRTEQIEKNIKQIEKKAEEAADVDEARVVSMFSGKYYYLFKYRVFRDVRIVYAPPHSIGKYGGDIDNWMWPRHTGDFAFFRVYTKPDGTPSEYSEDNVPYQPKRFVPFSDDGIKEGDFTFIMGYPGTTMRYRSSHSVNYYQNTSYPIRIGLFKDLLDLWENEGKHNPEVKIKYASIMAGFNNALKNNQGMLDGFKKLKLLDKKLAFEQDMMEFISSHKSLKKEYGSVLDELGAIYADLEKDALSQTLFGFTRYASSALSNALSVYQWSLEKEKPEMEREFGFDDKSIDKLKKSLPYRFKNVDPSVDAKALKLLLNKLTALPEEQVYPPIRDIFAGKDNKAAAIDEFVDALYSNTKMLSLDDYLKIMDMNKDELLNLKDPFVEFASKLYPYIKETQQKSKKYSGMISKIRPKYVEMVAIYKNHKNDSKLPKLKELKKEVITMYPDANRTIRLTYGLVNGYEPADAVIYKPFTTFSGILAKHTGEEPFDAPDKFFELEKSKDFGTYVDSDLKDVPVNFLHTTDITGGNSGSPVFNAKGEYIGIAFDGNYEAMTSDWQFSEELTRTISVDSRYILFLLDKFSNAQNLLNELEIH